MRCYKIQNKVLIFCHAYSIINAWQKESEVKRVSPKTGRPKAENPKDIRYSVRLDTETEKKLQNYCDVHGITKGEAIRRGIHLLLQQK